MNDKIKDLLCNRKLENLTNHECSILDMANKGTDSIYDIVWGRLLEEADNHLSDKNIETVLYYLDTDQFMNDSKFNEFTWNGLDSQPGWAHTFNSHNSYEQIIFVFLSEDAKGRTPILLNTLVALLKEDGIKVNMDKNSHKFTCSIERKQLDKLIDEAHLLTLRNRNK